MTVKKFFGGLFVAIGFLIMLLSGGCAFFFLFAAPLGHSLEDYIIVLLLGGIPFVAGILLFAGGRFLHKPPKEIKNPYLPDDSSDADERPPAP